MTGVQTCALPIYRHNLAGIAGRVKIHVADVRDWPRLPALIKGQDFLFNLAGQTSHLDSMTDPQTDLDINCRAQLAILEACRQHNPGIRIVFASTRQIYGRPDALPVAETHPLRPVDVNGINKLAGESFHLLYARVHGIRATALRLTNTIGPRMRIKDARQTFVGVWIRRLLEGAPIEVWGGQQLRDFTYVDDAVEAFLLAAAHDSAIGQVYNLGGPPPVSLQRLAEMLVALNQGGVVAMRPFPAERQRIDIDSLLRLDVACVFAEPPVAEVAVQRVVTDAEDAGRFALVAAAALVHEPRVATTPCAHGVIARQRRPEHLPIVAAHQQIGRAHV